MNKAVVKLCGMRRKEDISYANTYRPDYIGFIFAPSKRQISKEQAKELGILLNPSIKKVGVFVNEAIEKIIEIAKEVKLDVVQLHGDEDTAYLEQLRDELSLIKDETRKIEIWKAFRVASEKNILEATQYKCDKVLLDAYSEKGYGGTGERINLDLVKKYQNMGKTPFFVAGGITVENIEEVLDRIEPYGIDISSGIETEGFKDKDKIREVMKKIRSERDEE